MHKLSLIGIMEFLRACNIYIFTGRFYAVFNHVNDSFQCDKLRNVSSSISNLRGSGRNLSGAFRMCASVLFLKIEKTTKSLRIGGTSNKRIAY